MTKGERIKKRRLELGLTLDQVSKIVDVSRQTIQRYESGVINTIPSDKIELLATALKTTPLYIMGWENGLIEKENNLSEILDIIPVVPVDIPVIGDVQCGTPHEAIENAKMKTFQLVENLDVDFALRCKGDSMINDGIDENDYVFIKEQQTVRNGEIAVVIIDNEATLKRFYYYEETKMVILRAGNQTFPDRTYVGDKLRDIRIIGKVVKVLKNVQ